MKKTLAVLVISALGIPIFGVPVANAAPPQAATCAACHGAAGLGNRARSYPSLAGQPARYLYWQLLDFKRGSRKNPIMQRIAQTLSKSDRTALAQYYAALPVPATAQSAQSAHPSLGAQLARHGEWQRSSPGIPACDFCHGANGTGAGAFPRLAGQPASYLESQLRAWQTGARPAGPLGLMGHIARLLTRPQIIAVAHYYAALPPNPASNHPQPSQPGAPGNQP